MVERQVSLVGESCGGAQRRKVPGMVKGSHGAEGV